MKVVKPGNVEDRDTWVGKEKCPHCEAELEYNFKDAKLRKAQEGDHPMRDTPAYNYIKCPECEREISVVLPKFRP